MDLERLKPVGDKILVLRTTSPDTTKGGIVIPDTAKDKLTEGVVVAVGPGKLRKDGQRTPPPVRPGDKVLFGKYSGNEVDKDGKSYVLMNEDDLYGVFEGA